MAKLSYHSMARALLICSSITVAFSQSPSQKVPNPIPSTLIRLSTKATTLPPDCTAGPIAAPFDKKESPWGCNCWITTIFQVEGSGPQTTAKPLAYTGPVVLEDDSGKDLAALKGLCNENYVLQQPVCDAPVPDNPKDFAQATATCDCASWRYLYQDRGKHFPTNPCKGATYTLSRTVDKAGKALTCEPTKVAAGGYAAAIAPRDDCYCSGDGAKALWLGKACDLATIF